MAYIMELAKALKQEDLETRVRILKALMALKDHRATPSILEALDDVCLDVRRTAMRALSWIGDERVRPSFLEALRDDDFSYRFWAAIGLQKFGARASSKSGRQKGFFTPSLSSYLEKMEVEDIERVIIQVHS